MAAVTGYRLWAARDVVHAGGVDQGFYYELSRNLRDGRGPFIDYVFQFSPPPGDLTHYAVDYWMPLPAVIMALLSLVTGGGPGGAVTATILWSLLLVPATYVLARQLSDRWWIPPVAAALAVANPLVSRFVMRTDAATYAAVFVTAALALALSAGTNARRWAGAGALAGATYLCRNDGVFVALAVAALVPFVVERGRRARAARAAAVGCLTVVGPLLVANLVATGRIANGSVSRTVFLTSYERLYSYRATPSWAEYSELGAREMLTQRQASLGRSWAPIAQAQGRVILAVALTAIVGGLVAALIRRRASAAPGATQGSGRRWLVPIAFVFIPPLALTAVTPLIAGGGTVHRWSVGVVPLFVIAGLDGASRISLRRPVRAALGAAVAMCLVVASLGLMAGETRISVDSANGENQRFVAVTRLLEREAQSLDREVVVMTRFPWQVTTVTGFRSIMAPNDDLMTIMAVAHEYEVTHLLTPAHRLPLDDADALVQRGFLTPVDPWADGELYRLDPTAEGDPPSLE